MIEAYERAVLEWCTYIYLNRYENGCLYVGSHSWKGVVGELDPNYLGSSTLADSFGWVPVSVELLESVSKDRKFTAEREWMLKYCNEFGVHPTVKYLHPEFGSKFGIGLLLNCHSNSVEPALSSTARTKSYKTRKERGLIDKWVKSGSTKEVRDKIFKIQLESGSFHRFLKAAHSEESVKKRVATCKQNGAFERFMNASRSSEALKKAQSVRELNGLFQAMIDRAHSLEAISRRDFKSSSAKASLTKKELGIRPVRRKVEVVRDGTVLFTGSLGGACEFMGNRNWAHRIVPKLKTSTEVLSHGFIVREVSHDRSI